MAATTGYQAGIEANATQISYGIESVWGAAPATTFAAIRIVSESLSGMKKRDRPQEILATREVAAATTTQVSAGGDINFALSYATFDDFFSVLLGNDWQAAQTIAGAAGDITITSGTNVLSSTTANKFSAITQGSVIRTLGFTNAANNDFWRVTTAGTTSLTLAKLGSVAAVTETPAAAAAQVRASTIRNGTQFKSLFLQQKLSAALWLRYPGSFVTDGTLQAGVGSFFSGKFTIAAQQEINQTTDASTGGVTAAPSGRVHDPVSGFGASTTTGGMLLFNDVAVNAVVDSFTLNMSNNSAAAEFGMGSAAAQGMLMGTFQGGGSLKMFFKDFTVYSRFVSETLGTYTFITRDPTGNAYVVTLLNAVLMNPKIEAGGVGQAVYAAFDIECNPASAGGTVQLDRLPAT